MKYYVLDCNNLAHRAGYGYLKNPTFADNGAVYGMISDIVFLCEVLGQGQFIFCFDEGTSLRKKDYPMYKSKRDLDSPSKGSIIRQTNLLRTDVLIDFGFRNILSQDGAEADDLMAHVCDTLEDEEIVVVSSDNDFYQLLSNKISIWNPLKKQLQTKEWFKNLYDIEPVDWIEVKALMGCKTDTIQGISKIGIIGALSHVQNRYNPQNHVSSKGQAGLRIEANKELIDFNRKLISLPYYKLSLSPFELKKDELDRYKWPEICVKYSLDRLQNKYPF